MKKLESNILFLMVILIILTFFNTSHANAGSITVTVTNIKVFKGVIRIALYNKKQNFPKVDKEYKIATIPAYSNKISFTFTDIPEGWYAIALYHDINNNNNCDKNLLGIPTEPFGFSRNFKVKFSALAFDKCSFYLKHKVNLSIELYKK